MNDPNLPQNLYVSQHKDRKKTINSIRNRIEIGTGKSISKLRAENTEDKLFYLALQHVVTTKKALCEALGIPVEGACRYKRFAEKESLLVQSTDRHICPYTRHLAHLITTNPAEFDNLRQSKDTQLSLLNF